MSQLGIINVQFLSKKNLLINFLPKSSLNVNFLPKQYLNIQFIPKQNLNVQFKKNRIEVSFLRGIRDISGGGLGTNDHALLNNLDYSNAGHTNFQKKINYIPEFKAYEIP